MFDNLGDEEEDQNFMSEEEADNISASNNEEEQYDDDDQAEEYSEEESDEDEDVQADLEVLKNATLRLEQGNLYKMLLKHDLFDGVDADKRAINNVQRELRSFIRERLEVMLGIRQDPRLVKKDNLSNHFTDLEIMLLKEVVSKATGKFGMENSSVSQNNQPKKLGINPVQSQNNPLVRVNSVKQTSNRPQLNGLKQQNVKKKQSSKNSQTSKEKESENGWLDKPPSQMTQEELVAYNKHVSQKQVGKKAQAILSKKIPMPDANQIHMMYATRVAQSGAGGMIGAILAKTGKSLGVIEDVGGADGDYDDNNSRM